MLTGIYRAAMGMRGQLDIQDTLTNNLSNAATTAYKRQMPVFRDVLATSPYESAAPMNAQGGLAPASVFIGDDVAYVSTSYNDTMRRPDRQTGAMKVTGVSLDLAIEGDGMFAIQGPGGQTLYTRAGAFRKDSDGHIVTGQGYKVLGESGRPVQLPDGEITFGRDGSISVNGQAIDRLMVVQLSGQSGMLEVEGGVYTGGGARPVEKPNIKQGVLEASNVNVVEEMVAMISSLRAYEAAQKVITSADGILGRAVNELGKA